VIQCPEGDFEVHTAHVPPGSSNLWVKIEVLEGIFRGLKGRSQRPRIFCGDLNTPQSETASGDVVTWAQRLSASGRVVLRRRIRGGPGVRWDAAERAILTGLGQSGMTDVFRSFHGYGSSPASWVLRRKDKAIGRRFDHIFASSEFQVVRCSYLHEWRELGYSDHSALEAELELPRAARTRMG
jgi:exonuclease III